MGLGGIAGVLDPDDSEAIESHVKDTLESGADSVTKKVRSVISEASERIRDLIGMGGVRMILQANTTW